MTKKDKIIDKVAKLLNHAESAENIGSLAEAEAFAAQAARLMAEHHIGMSDIEYAEYEQEQVVERTWVKASEFGFNDSSRRLVWAETLSGAVAKAHFCRAFGQIGSNRLQFVGATQDREQAIRVFHKLNAARGTLGTAEYRRMKREGLPTKGFWSGWNKGFAHGVLEKVNAEMWEVHKELEASNETGLMRINSAIAKTNAFVLTNLRFVNGSSGTSYGSGSAYNAGRRAGRGTSFKNNQLT